MGQLGMVEEAGPRAATTQRSRVGPGPAKVGLRATATLLQKGDIVVYASYAGTEVEVNGESHLVMRESELLGVMQ